MTSLGGEADVDVDPGRNELLQLGLQAGDPERLPQVVIGPEFAFVVRAVRELGRGVASEPRVGGLAKLDAVEAGNQPRGDQRSGPTRRCAPRACRGRRSGWQLVRFGVREPGAR